jgi:syntaxin 5
VAKKKSLFDDKPKEIQDLTYLIKQDINNLQTDIARLQEVNLFLKIILKKSL